MNLPAKRAEIQLQDIKFMDETYTPDNEEKRGPGEDVMRLIKWAGEKNLASKLSTEELDTLGATASTEFEIDLNSRKDWEKSAKAAMENVKAKREGKSYPFQNASDVKYPLLVTATLQFAARAYPAIVNGPAIVKVPVFGKDPEGKKAARGQRVGEFMSYQLVKKMPEWPEDTDVLLHQLPVVGCAFRKTYWSFEKGRPCSEMVSAFDFVVNNTIRTLEDCPRATHILPPLYPHEIEERVRAGTFLDIDHGMPEEGGDDSLAPHEFLEQHRRIDIDNDGYAEPYIVTIHKSTNKVVRIVANYDPLKIMAVDGKIIRVPANTYFTKYSFIPDPAGGFYDVGYGELLENITSITDSTLNQLLDAGHLQNAGGGFIGAGLDIGSSTFIQEPGKYHTVNASGSSLRDNIVPMQHPGPSDVLFKLLGLIIDAGKEVSSISDVITGDVERNQTATTTLALIEQGLKVFTAIYKRIYRSLSREFQLLYDLNGKHLDVKEYERFVDENIEPEQPMMGHNGGPLMEQSAQGSLPLQEPQQAPIAPQIDISEDFNPDDMDICPMANPNEVTDMQKLGRAQVIREVSQDPIINKVEAMKRYLEAAGVEDIDGLIVVPRPSQIEALNIEAAKADIAKKNSEAEKNKAIAGKAESGAMKDGADILTSIENSARQIMQGQADDNRGTVY